MKLIMVRHGATSWNHENRILGRTDIPLDEVGRRQAEKAALLLADYDIARIYSSPLKRAYETADIIEKYHDCEITVDERLVEMHFGIFEGLSRDDPEYQKAKRQYFARYPGGGESFQDISARVYAFLNEIREKHRDETVAIVTHNGICRVVVTYFGDLTNEEFVTHVMDNCEFRIFECD